MNHVSPEVDLLTSDHDPQLTPDLSIFVEKAGKFVVLEPPKSYGFVDHNLDILLNLPDIPVSFKVVEDTSSRLISMKEIDQDLALDGTMDKRRADIVAESFPSLFEVVNRNGFTRTPTKVGLKETRNFLIGHIVKEEAQLIDTFKTYIEAPFDTSVCILNQIKESYFPGLLRITESLKSELQATPFLVSDTKTDDTYAFIDQEIRTLDIKTIKTRSYSVAEFQEAIRSIQIIFNCTDLQMFYNRTWRVESGQPITIRDLITFILDTRYFSELENIGKSLDLLKNKVDLLVQEVKQVSDKPDKISEFVVRHADTFVLFHSDLTRYSTLIYYLTTLNLSIKVLILALNAMKG